ncbi:MAG: PHP domain-containing protein [Bacillota bacterium]|nr:PHP domain-containing protein [Bacillota bacterium]
MNTFRQVDLHIHSTASDGSFEPEKIVRVALEAGVGIMALTDHDSLKNNAKMKELAEKAGITFIPGVEVSSTLEDEVFHILGYNIDLNNEKLNHILKSNTSLLERKDDEFIKLLVKKGYSINFEDYERYEHKSSRGGWKALSFLIDAGLCVDVKDYFTRLWIAENEVKFPIFPHPQEVIKALKEAGGTAVLAHPYYSPCDESVESRLKRFLEIGIMGVECFHPNHKKDVSLKCLNWCKNNGITSTAGSDSHGDLIITRHIGKPIVFENEINISELLRG